MRELVVFPLFCSIVVVALFVTNSPIFEFSISPIVYHETCFESPACLMRSADNVPYVACRRCNDDDEGVHVFLNGCAAPIDSVVPHAGCALWGGFCVSLGPNRSVCSPALPCNGVYWPEAIPVSSSTCRSECGEDRAYFSRWNESAGIEKKCYCHCDAPSSSRVSSGLFQNREIYRLFLLELESFCPFSDCPRANVSFPSDGASIVRRQSRGVYVQRADLRLNDTVILSPCSLWPIYYYVLGTE